MKDTDRLFYPTMCILNVLLFCKAKIGEQYEFALMCAKRMGYGKADATTIAGLATHLWWNIHK